MMFADICEARKHCGDCRSRPAWRLAFGAPEVCPFGVGGPNGDPDQIKNIVTGEYALAVSMTEKTPLPCLSCSLFKAETNQCGKCGCASEALKLRHIADIKICPKKLWYRRKTEVSPT